MNHTYTFYLSALPSFSEGMARVLDLGATLEEYNDSPGPPWLITWPCATTGLPSVLTSIPPSHNMNEINRQDHNLQNNNRQQNELIRSISIAEISAGPLPSPKVLREYDDLVPGTAAKIIAMAERQSNHRQHIETQVVRTRTRNSRLGLIFGLLIGLASLTAATVSAINGSNVVGSVIGVSGLASLAGVFVYGSQQQRQERQERLKTFTHKKQQ